MDRQEQMESPAPRKKHALVWRAAKRLCVAILLFLALYMLAFDFYDNRWGVVYDDAFLERWGWDSQGLAQGKVLSSRENGVFYERGLLPGYPSQVGLHGMAYSVIDAATGHSDKIFNYLQFANCVLLAGLLILLAVWFWREFGVLAGLFCYGSSFFSYWMIASSHNLFFVMWTMFFPFMAMLFLFWREKSIGKKWFLPVAGAVAFLACAIRFGCGFEFSSTILISLEIPLIYYAFRRRWGWRRYWKAAVVVGGCAVLAFVVVFVVNLWQQAGYYGSWETAWQNMQYVISKRTGAFDVALDEIYAISLEVPLWSLFRSYFTSGTPPLIGNYRMDVILFVFLLVFLLTWLDGKLFPTMARHKHKVRAMCLAAAVSVMGPVSWFVLARGHSQIHRHINYILWSLPCLPLIFGVAGAVFAYLGRDAFRHLFVRAKTVWWPALKALPKKRRARHTAKEDGE